MRKHPTTSLLWALIVCALVGTPVCAMRAATAPATVRQVKLLGGTGMELEILTTQPVSPQTQSITGPDRIVIDLPNAVPGPGLRTFHVNRKELKSVRVGQTSMSPPVTRVVLDLKSPQGFQIFPSGNRLIVKVGGKAQPAAAAALPNAAGANPGAAVPVQRVPHVAVDFQGGRLSIRAREATLAEVLFEVHRKTGAEIAIPAGSEQEQVVVELGPAPAREVLAALFNGSRFNYIAVGSDSDPNVLRSVLLTPRSGMAAGSAAMPMGGVPMQQGSVPPRQSTVAMPPTGTEPEIPPMESDEDRGPETDAPPQR